MGSSPIISSRIFNGALVEARFGSLQQGTSPGPGGSNSVVESQPSKLLVAGSIPVSRSKYLKAIGHWARSRGEYFEQSV